MVDRAAAYDIAIEQAARGEITPEELLGFLAKDLNDRMTAQEERALEVERVADTIEAQISASVYTGLQVEIDRIHDAADLGQLFEAASASTLTVATGEITLVVADDDKPRFSAPGWILLTATGEDAVWMLGRRVSYDRPSGLLVVDIERVSGLGETASAWSIAAASEGTVPTAGDGDYNAGQIEVSPIVRGENRVQGALEALSTGLDGRAPFVSRSALKAMTPAPGATVLLIEAGVEGLFKWQAGDFSSICALDESEGIYISSQVVNTSSGAWVRLISAAGGEFRPEWFGARFDGLTDDTIALRAWIAVGLARGLRTFRFPPGSTRVGGALISQGYAGQDANWTDQFIFLIDSIPEVVQILIEGTTFIVVGAQRGQWGNLFGAVNGGGIVIYSNCGVVDYVNLPFVQGTLKGKTETTATFALDPDTPLPAWSNIQRLEEIDDTDPNYGPRWKRNILVQPYTLGGGLPVEGVSGDLQLSVTTVDDRAAIAGMNIGERYILTHQIYGADIVHTRRVKTMQIHGELNVYATAGMLIRATGCDTVDFSGLRAVRKPGTNRAVVAPGGGMILTDIVDNVRGVGFYFERLYDDPINISAFRLNVSGTSGASTMLLSGVAYPYQPPAVGEELFWMDASTGAIEAIGRIASMFWNGSALETTMDTELPVGLGSGDYVFPGDKAARVFLDGFTIEHCRGHGVLLQTADVSVRGTVRNVSGSAVSMWRNPGYYAEANRIGKAYIDVDVYDCARGTASPGAIGVWATKADGSFEPAGNIVDVTIKGKIEKCDQCAVFVAACDDVSVEITIDDSNKEANTSLWGGAANHCVAFLNCTDISIAVVNRDTTRSVGILGTLGQVRRGDLIRTTLLPKTVPAVAGVQLRANIGSGVDFTHGSTLTGFAATQASGVSYNNITGVITIEEPGLYHISGKITVDGMASAGDGSVILKHTPAGGAEYDLDYVMVVTGSTEVIPGVVIVTEYLGQGDTLRMVASDASGSPTGVRVAMYQSFSHIRFRRVG